MSVWFEENKRGDDGCCDNEIESKFDAGGQVDEFLLFWFWLVGNLGEKVVVDSQISEDVKDPGVGDEKVELSVDFWRELCGKNVSGDESKRFGDDFSKSESGGGFEEKFGGRHGQIMTACGVTRNIENKLNNDRCVGGD